MKLLAVFGNPIAHSLSPLLHNAALGNAPDTLYTRVLVPDETALRTAFESLRLAGANITVPFKEAAFRQSDEVRGIAAKIGAVNTWVREGEKIIGYNTDAAGFLAAIEHFGKPDGKFPRALILGAGGTAKAIATIFAEQGYDFTVINRSAERLGFFAERGMKCADYTQMPNGAFEMIINTTSAGLKDDQLPLPAGDLERYFARAKIAVDVVYGKQTPFLQAAQAHNLQTQDGLKMLIMQAVKAFELFFGNEPRNGARDQGSEPRKARNERNGERDQGSEPRKAQNERNGESALNAFDAQSVFNAMQRAIALPKAAL